MKISRILHAGYVLESDDVQIAFDPIFENPFSRNCYAYPNVSFDGSQITQLNFAAVFISHYHDDHCSLESLNCLSRKTPIYLYCVFPELFEMLKKLGFKNVFSLQIDSPVYIGPFTITPRLALDVDVDSIFHIQAEGLNILNLVDSWIHPDTMEVISKFAPWDLVLWPFQLMREIEVLSPRRHTWQTPELPVEWVPQLRALNPKNIVPSSCQFIHEPWSWYNTALFPISYSHFTDWIKNILPDTRVVRMNPGMSFDLQSTGIKSAGLLKWIFPIGDQGVEYGGAEFDIPSTKSIAQNFPALTAVETEFVINFCKRVLLEKYQALETVFDEYFNKPRNWKLTLFDHLGNEITFYYQITSRQIRTTEPCATDLLSWTTEVPIAKLYAALKHGESLTSMYVRINSEFFLPEFEMDLAGVDVLEDPLVRCLFSETAIAYQQAQLKRFLAES